MQYEPELDSFDWDLICRALIVAANHCARESHRKRAGPHRRQVMTEKAERYIALYERLTGSARGR